MNLDIGNAFLAQSNILRQIRRIEIYRQHELRILRWIESRLQMEILHVNPELDLAGMSLIRSIEERPPIILRADRDDRGFKFIALQREVLYFLSVRRQRQRIDICRFPVPDMKETSVADQTVGNVTANRPIGGVEREIDRGTRRICCIGIAELDRILVARFIACMNPDAGMNGIDKHRIAYSDVEAE